MAIIDFDSYLRDGWFLDEIYQLPEPFARYTPERIGSNVQGQNSRVSKNLSPIAKAAVGVLREDRYGFAS